MQLSTDHIRGSRSSDTAEIGTRRKDLLSSAALVAVLALVSAASVLLLRGVTLGFDYNTFVMVGEIHVTKGLPAEMRRAAPGDGFDGQYFYQITGQLLNDDPGLRLDNPPYRAQRIGYPVLTAAVELLGRPLSVPRAAAMIFVNVVALVLLAYVGARFAISSGRSAFWGLLLAWSPSSIVALTRSTSELVEVLFLVLAVIAAMRNRLAVAVVLGAAAILTRETSLTAVFFAAVAAWWFAPGGAAERRRRVWLVPIPLIVEAVWQFGLHLWQGQAPALQNTGVAAFPFSMTIKTLADLPRDVFMAITEHSAYYSLGVALGPLMLIVLALIATTVVNRRDIVLAAGWAGGVVIMSIMGADVWSDTNGYWRGAADVVALGLLVVLRCGGWPLLTYAAVLGSASWIVLLQHLAFS